MAGITVDVMLIPQSMSYASIIGLQPGYGIYAGFMPVLVYAFMGTSRQIAVGSVAIVSLFTASGLNGQLTQNSCPALYTPYPSEFPEVWLPGVEPVEGVIPHECAAEYAKLAFLLFFFGLHRFWKYVNKLGTWR